MRPPRLTIRRLMIVVANVSILVWHAERRRLAATYRTRAGNYSMMTFVVGRSRYVTDVKLDAAENERASRAFYDSVHRRELYYQSLAEKYERAASYPWLPVAPDPPEPQ